MYLTVITYNWVIFLTLCLLFFQSGRKLKWRIKFPHFSGQIFSLFIPMQHFAVAPKNEPNCLCPVINPANQRKIRRESYIKHAESRKHLEHSLSSNPSKCDHLFIRCSRDQLWQSEISENSVWHGYTYGKSYEQQRLKSAGKCHSLHYDPPSSSPTAHNQGNPETNHIWIQEGDITHSRTILHHHSETNPNFDTPISMTHHKHCHNQLNLQECEGTNSPYVRNNAFRNMSQYHMKQCLTPEEKNKIEMEATSFMDTVCLELGKKTYCLPQIKRFSSLNTSGGGLIAGIDNDRRIFGSFERYFAENQHPVFMLCHYPITGFMQAKARLNQKSQRLSCSVDRNTIALLLLSDLFTVTMVTTNNLRGTSDIYYMQVQISKAVGYSKKCHETVVQWLSFLGIIPKVRQVIAFPNLKRTQFEKIMQKQLEEFFYIHFLTLDELPAAFQEEFTNEDQKQVFNHWMKQNIMSNHSCLSLNELRYFIGALLSPRLSNVDFVKNLEEIQPVPEYMTYEEIRQGSAEEIHHLQITIDGICKPFVQYMEEYVNSYYPNWDKKTYRVPPIRFNNQSFKKPADYLLAIKEEISSILEEHPNSIHSVEEFQKSITFTDVQKGIIPSNQNSVTVNEKKFSNGNSLHEEESCNENKISSQKTSEGGRIHRAPVVNVACKEKALQDVHILSKVMTKDVRSGEGENRVICALEMLGEKYGPMFIICGYQYNNYLNKLREEMFPLRETKRPIRAFGQSMRAEHDCLIFHKKYGAIIVCIKAIGDNFAEWDATHEQQINSINKIIKKAVKQLQREETLLKHVTSDLYDKLACRKLIALPNLSRKSVDKAIQSDRQLEKTIRETLGHGVELFLCSDELPSQFQQVEDCKDDTLWMKLVNWWGTVWNQLQDDQNGIDSWVYRQLIGRYCGLLSTVEVWTDTNPRVEVRNMSEAVKVCAERFCKFVLLPHQIEVLCSDNPRSFLYGPPGCGKTLVLILKAKEWLLAGESVILINARPGSSQGYPYAYGLYRKLQKINRNNVHMITVDSLHFKASEFREVLASHCVIMDEVTPSSHEIIKHLCCRPVKNILCAGLFEEDKPYTELGFVVHKMHKILRCPPIVQSVLKYTEQEVRLKRPYRNNYQSSALEMSYSSREWKSLLNDDSSISDTVNECMGMDVDSSEQSPANDLERNNESERKLETETCVENLSQAGLPNGKFSNDFEINEDLHQKIQQREMYITSSFVFGLPTDGPKPFIIDHSKHQYSGKPADCRDCGRYLADFLKSMIKIDDVLILGQTVNKKINRHSNTMRFFENTGQLCKTNYRNLFSQSSSFYTNNTDFENKALTCSDVLIVAREIQEDCALVGALRKQQFPIEVLMKGGDTSRIEDRSEKKLFITSYKEVTGLERALIVFVPSECSANGGISSAIDTPYLELRHSLRSFTEADCRAVWHVASRSLASLVLILP